MGLSRFAADYPVGKTDDCIRLIAEDYLNKEGFKPVLYKGEWVWKKGQGILTAPQYIKLTCGGGVVHIEAFLRNAILPGVYVGEMGLDGAWGFLVKDMLRGKVNELVRLLSQPLPGDPAAAFPVSPAVPAAPPASAPPAAGTPVSAAVPAAAPAAYPGVVGPAPGETAVSMAGGVPAPAAPPAAGPLPAPGIPVAVHNPTGKAKLGFAFGLCSLIGIFLPLLGIVFSIVGLVNARVGLKSTSRGLAVAGMVLSMVFLVVSVIDGLAGIFRALLWLA